MSKSARVAPKEFVKIWQESPALEDVVNTLGLNSITAARSRARIYRKKGIDLKHFPGTRGAPSLNIEELNEVAAKFAPKDGATASKPKAAKKRKSKAKSKKN